MHLRRLQQARQGQDRSRSGACCALAHQSVRFDDALDIGLRGLQCDGGACRRLSRAHRALRDPVANERSRGHDERHAAGRASEAVAARLRWQACSEGWKHKRSTEQAIERSER
eukprot:364407-Chlamydomonas_euryale.AAC.8